LPTKKKVRFIRTFFSYRGH